MSAPKKPLTPEDTRRLVLGASAPQHFAQRPIRLAGTTPIGREPGRTQVDRMNRGERRYRDHLQLRRSAGDVLWFEYEPWTLRLADSTHYRCDFGVLLSDGTLEVHDVKGRRGASFWVEEDSWVKIKAAAAKHPFVFRVVWQSQDGFWKDQVIPG